MLTEVTHKDFENGTVYLLKTDDGYPIEVTDTFLPYYTKDAIGERQNVLHDYELGSRKDRWMIGVSTMSGCPVRCKFCATGKLRRTKLLSAIEILEQITFILAKHKTRPRDAREFKINYTRMGEPFLNIEAVKDTIDTIDANVPGVNVHHYISTIGIEGADYSWVKPNVTIQFSVHSFDEEYRDWLIPYRKKITVEEMGQVRTDSNNKTTLNMTMVRPEDFDLPKLERWFDKKEFFVKVSPINPNDIADKNGINNGVISQKNLV